MDVQLVYLPIAKMTRGKRLRSHTGHLKMASMEAEPSPAASSSSAAPSKGEKKRFEVKKVGGDAFAAILAVIKASFRSGAPSLFGHGVKSRFFACYAPAKSFLDIVVDNCAICRNHIMDLCEKIRWAPPFFSNIFSQVSNARRIKRRRRARSAPSHGAFAT